MRHEFHRLAWLLEQTEEEIRRLLSRPDWSDQQKRTLSRLRTALEETPNPEEL